MTTASWNGVVLAESNDTVVVEGNHYFPHDSVKPEVLKASSLQTECPWKGTAHYYTVLAGSRENPDAAWYYPAPKPAASQIKNRVAFWKGVTVR